MALVTLHDADMGFGSAVVYKTASIQSKHIHFPMK